MSLARRGSRTLILTVVALAVGSCRQNVPLTEPAEGNASFGEAMFESVCMRVGYSHELDVRASSPTVPIDVSGNKYRPACTGTAATATEAPKVNVLTANRDALIRALNFIIPDDLLDAVSAFLEAILPIYDDGTFKDANLKLGAVLRMLGDDADLSAALARITGREGYRPLDAALGVVRKIVEYPDIDAVLLASLRSLDEGGAGHDAFTNLTQALHYELMSAQPVQNPASPERTLNLTLGLLFSEDAKGRFGSGTPKLLVRRDQRGVAKVLRAGTALPAPFTDLDGDGLPDVDAAGRFVDAAGQPLVGYWPFPTKDGSGSGPRDSLGRLLAGSQPVYEYLDLDNTLLAGVMRDGLQLFDPTKDTALGLARGAGALMGPRQTATKEYLLPDGHAQTLTYTGFDPNQAPLLDLLYGFLQILAAPNIDAVLEGSQRLIDLEEDSTAWLLGAALGIKEFAKRPEFATAAIPEASKLYDDLLPVLRRVLADPGLTADLMDALRDPITQNLGRVMSYYMTYADRWDINPNDVNAPPIGSFTTKVNRQAADTGFNRSLNHRLFHLIHDTNGAKLCNKAGATVTVASVGLTTYDTECSMFEIDNLAKFYIQAIIGKAVFPINKQGLLTLVPDSLLDSTMEGSLGSGITGFTTHPTVESLNRVLFQDPTSDFVKNLQNDPLCVDGETIKTAHAGTIFAWEARPSDFRFTPTGNVDPNRSLFYQSLAPIIRAFANHDAEGLFLDLVSVFYHHWSTAQAITSGGACRQSSNPTAPFFCYGDGAVRYEPLVAAVFDPLNASVYPDAPPYAFDLMPALHASAQPLGDLTLADGRLARPELVALAAWLLNPQQGLVRRDGSAQKAYDRLVPYEGIDHHEQGSESLSGYELITEGLKAKRAALAAAGANADAWNQSTSDLVDLFLAVEPTAHRFKNRHFVATTMQVVPFVRGRVARHRSDGDLTQWLRQTLPQDLEDGLASPVFAALYDLADALATDEEARTAIYGLLTYLVDEAHQSEAFMVALTAAADLVQLLVADSDLVPILRAAGRALDPTIGVAEAQVAFLHRARERDDGQILGTLLKNMWLKYGSGDTPFGTFADVTTEVHRVQPGLGQPLTAPDYQAIFGQAADFFDDNERGLVRFVDIVAARKLQP